MSVSAFAFTPSSALLPAAPHTSLASDAHPPSALPPPSTSLLDCIKVQTRLARLSGALQTIPTHCKHIKDTGLLFPVRIKTEEGVYNKPDVLTDNLRKRDPFVPPYEEDLFVKWDFSVGPAHSPISKHVIVLNKYNVLPNHALIVTTNFLPQTDPLDEEDFGVFWRSVDSVKGFGFYNCGANAGPSQPHKHMQVVPLPLEDGTDLPLLRILDEHAAAASSTRTDSDEGAPFTVSRFGFTHACCSLPRDLSNASDQEIGGRLMEIYRGLLSRVQVSDGHHNVLLSTRWMLVVPRTREGMDGLSGNGLVFAGVFFTKDQELCDRLATIGPTNFLARVTS